LNVDGERNKQLLQAVVEVALDSAAVDIGSQREPLSRCPQLVDLDAKPFQRLLQRLDVTRVQGDRPPGRVTPRKLSATAWAASRGGTPHNAGGQPAGESPCRHRSR
jgi:hypothetical protein